MSKNGHFRKKTRFSRDDAAITVAISVAVVLVAFFLAVAAGWVR